MFHELLGTHQRSTAFINSRLKRCPSAYLVFEFFISAANHIKSLHSLGQVLHKCAQMPLKRPHIFVASRAAVVGSIC